MKNKSRKELYEILRSGSEEEARAAEEELIRQDKKDYGAAVQKAVPAICMRNFSHSIGPWLFSQ